MTVSVVSCLYGTSHHKFIERWTEAIHNLHPQPDRIVVATDRRLEIPGVCTVESLCDWRHPQAYHQQRAVQECDTDWVWLVDIDDLPYPNGLYGLDFVAADVWQMGFDRSDGETYIPPRLTPDEFLAAERNVYVGTSAFRTDIFHDAGGFPDVALQDWALWRRLARLGATVESSGRTHFQYMRHPQTRGAVELTTAARAEHLAEMMEAELAHA